MKNKLLIFMTILATAVFGFGLCACDKDGAPSLPQIGTEDPGTEPPGDSETPSDTETPGGTTPGGTTPGGTTPGGTTPGGTTPGGTTPGGTTPEPSKPNAVAKPAAAATTIYYSNSGGWSSVYAYVWNYKSGTNKVAWPGEKLTSIGSNNIGQTQYSVQVDTARYDRIIFNNGLSGGSERKTKDLIASCAASGYYDEDGCFTMNKDDYGSVRYVTLTDTKNLTYISNNKKKISVYTPTGYTTAKKYDVLYMFDSQNLYLAASGAEQHHDNNGSWACDVAVNNLVKNGGDGLIIVAIDNTDGHRDPELTMSQAFGELDPVLSAPEQGDFKNGKLDELGNFMKETLMPWVKENYSVDGSREHTGIAGSSSGGLAAYYLGLRDNDLYGYIGAFSPANGLFKQPAWNKFYYAKNFGSSPRPRIYAYCGYNDGSLEDMLVPATRQIANIKSYGYTAAEIIENYVERGTHSEQYWRIAFMDFLGKML